jgi:ABC-type antimicrobial peptide transport system permease subunit
VGLYAVTAHSVSQRTREIGIRMALGAGPRQVARMILRRALVQLACGFWAGVACARLWDWTFSSGQAGVRASDPRSLLIVAALLGIVAVIACAVPARRAIRLDPVAAIRHE